MQARNGDGGAEEARKEVTVERKERRVVKIINKLFNNDLIRVDKSAKNDHPRVKA